MKLALITIPGLYGAYFARRIQASFPQHQVLAFCQDDPPAVGAAATARNGSSDGAVHASSSPAAGQPLQARLFRRLYWKAYESAAMRIDPLRAGSIWEQPNVVRTTDINAPSNVERLAAFAPDVILIFGGKIVRAAVLDTARLVALNLHGGKLPEYRGTNGIKWMLWNGDVDRLCATVHVAAARVDAGEIVREARVPLRRGDSYRTIFARLHVAGVRAMIEAVASIERGSLHTVPQQGTPHTYRARDWSPRHEHAMNRRLAMALAKQRMRPLERRIVFHGYRRLHPLGGRLLEPHPSGSVALLYHHVAADESPYVRSLGITIHPAHFEDHVRYLTTHFDVVPFSTLAERDGDPRAVAITFDDGFASVATTALPIAERYRCPIKVYVCESLLQERLTWVNKLSVLMEALSPRQLTALMGEALDGSVPSVGREPIFDFIERFLPARTPAVIDRYFARVHPGVPDRIFLDEQEIRRLLDHPLVEVGSHTRHHFPQHRLDVPERHDEIVGAHRDLVARFGDRVHGFALPFGYREHFTPEVIAEIGAVDRAVVSAYGGYSGDRRIGGVTEIPRVGAWGNVGTLWHQMARTA